jgi:hypothetical protein
MFCRHAGLILDLDHSQARLLRLIGRPLRSSKSLDELTGTLRDLTLGRLNEW